MRFRSLLKVWLCSARFTCTGALLTLALVAVWWQPTVTAQSQTLVGTLEVVWGDPHPTLSATSDLRYELALPDGVRQPLELPGLESQATQYLGQRVAVTVSAYQSPSGATPAGAAAPSMAVVTSIALSPTAQSAAAPGTPATPAVLGSRSVIYLLVKFSDDAAVPHPPSFYTNMNNPDTPPAGEVFPATINGFFKKTSWNQFSWNGDVGGVGGIGAPGGWLTLPQPKSFYANCGWGASCASLNTLADDATALGRAQGIDFKNYANINFVLSNDLDCCAWGGGYYSAVDGKSYGATWEPPWGQDASVYSHEMGHSIGLPHSGWVYYGYDSPWDVMSNSYAYPSVPVNCGSYNSKNAAGSRTLTCSEPGDGFITAHTDYLGWIPTANRVVTDTVTGGTAALEGSALPMGAGIKQLKICLPSLPCTGSSAHYLTVEARVKGLGTTSRFDNGIPGDGVIIHDVLFGRSAISGKCFSNNSSGWAVPIDATPGDYDSAACTSGGRPYPTYGLFNAQWAPGQTYTNSTYGVSVSVLSRSGSTFVVSVSGSAPPAAPTGLLAALGGSAGVRLTWTASTSATTYTVKRGTASGGESVLAAGIAGTAYTDATAVKGVRYYYVVSASNARGESSNSAEVALSVPVLAPPPDADGDGKADLTVFRPSTGGWWTLKSSGNFATYTSTGWGLPGDTPVPGDYDGDGKMDLAVYRPTTGGWWILQSSTNFATYNTYGWGLPGDTPVPADYDGDGKTDLAIYRPSNGSWWILKSSTTFTTYNTYGWGLTGDVPVTGDYDGDSKADLAIYRPTTGGWWILKSSTTFATYSTYGWGLSGDTPVAADYDGDGKADLAIYRPTDGGWWILKSSTNFATYNTYAWGLAGDTPVLGDFDGDGKTDPAIYRPSTGGWWILKSSASFATYNTYAWGLAGDVPVIRKP